MATDHTDGAPPKRGSTNFVNIGCTMNKSEALRMMGATNVASSKRRAVVALGVVAFSERSAGALYPPFPAAFPGGITLPYYRPCGVAAHARPGPPRSPH